MKFGEVDNQSKIMKTIERKITIPEEPFGPVGNSSMEPKKYVEEITKLLDERKGSLCAIQFLGCDEGVSPAKIQFDRLKGIYYNPGYKNWRHPHDERPSEIYIQFKGLNIGLRGYDRIGSTAVTIVDGFNNILYRDSETEKKWWKEFKKLKKMAVPAEKARLLGWHKPREKALIEYGILNYLIFQANFKLPEGKWPF